MSSQRTASPTNDLRNGLLALALCSILAPFAAVAQTPAANTSTPTPTPAPSIGGTASTPSPSPQPGKAQSGTRVLNTVSGTSFIRFVADGGKAVRKDEVIFILDPAPLTANFHKALETLQTAENQARAANKAVEDATADKATKLANATYEIAVAEAALEKYVKYEGPAALLGLRLAVEDARAAFELQSDRFDARDQLLKDGYIQKVEYDGEATRLTRTKLTLESATLRLDAFTQFDQKQATERLERAAREKRTALESITRSADAAISTAQATAKNLAENLPSLRAERDKLRSQVKKTIIKAPADGVLTIGEPASPSTKLETGSEVKEGAVLGTISKN